MGQPNPIASLTLIALAAQLQAPPMITRTTPQRGMICKARLTYYTRCRHCCSGPTDVYNISIYQDLSISAVLLSMLTGGILAELKAGAGYQLLVHNGDISYARGYGTQVRHDSRSGAISRKQGSNFRALEGMVASAKHLVLAILPPMLPPLLLLVLILLVAAVGQLHASDGAPHQPAALHDSAWEPRAGLAGQWGQVQHRGLGRGVWGATGEVSGYHVMHHRMMLHYNLQKNPPRDCPLIQIQPSTTPLGTK